jgi:RHS repeat-associated protein
LSSGFSICLRSSELGGQVVAEIDATGQMKRGYVYMGGQMLALQDTDTGAAGGTQQVSWAHQDPVTKSQRFTSSNGTLLANKVDLDPWGIETDMSASSEKQPHRYTTYERDANGSDEAMMRRYSSRRSRFDQPDPYEGSYNLTDPQSFNRYSYTQNDPVNFVDPTGLEETMNCQVGAHGEVTCGNVGSVTVTTSFIDAPSTPSTDFYNDVLDLNNGDDLIDIGEFTVDVVDTGEPQNPVKISEIGEPPPLGPLHCDQRIIDAMNQSANTAFRIRKADGRMFEVGFTFDVLPGGGIRINMNRIDLSQGSNRMFIDINQYTVALLHYHHGSLDPNGADLNAAHGGNRKDSKGNRSAVQQNIDVYAFSPSGLAVYDPNTKKSTKLRDGQDWKSAKNCK